MSNKECRRDWSSGILSDRQLEVLSGYNTTVDDWSDCPLISPFIPRQVKTGGIISYGLSSYGYDVRISDEFKIISSSVCNQLEYDWLVENEAPSYKIPKPAIIDPTELDPLIFEDFKGSEIIIPPHGFVLGRTIEVVNIPRDVMVIALAKSTWARCFTGDTKVALVDGRALSFLELIDGVSKGERYWGYTIKTDGTIGVEELKNPRLISQNEELVEVTLDNEQTIRVTPDHEFMLRDGSYCQAQNLQPDTSLMPLYRYIHRGYETIHCPKTGVLNSTHRLVDEWNIYNLMYSVDESIDEHRHHVDFNRRNNNPSNIVRLPVGEHIRLHNERTWLIKDRMSHGQAISNALQEKYEDPTEFEKFCALQSQKAHDFWHDNKHAETRASWKKQNLENWTPEKRGKFADIIRRRWADGEFNNRPPHLNRPDLTSNIVASALKLCGSIKKAAEQLMCSRQLLFRRFISEIQQAQLDGDVATNHTVVSVKKLDYKEAVYCLEVPNTNNFALEFGVFVHNCGLVVGVTPLEPGFEGTVTIELSNTTNLPIRVKAGHGICQFLFLKGSQPCEVSYADRGGKYMGQIGVTLPRNVNDEG